MVALFALALSISAVAMITRQDNTATAQTAACPTNDIIRCGVTDRADFREKYYDNELNDLYAIYANYGIRPVEVARYGVEGTVNRDGTVRANGRVVATDAYSLGRDAKPYSNPVNIGNGTYHESRAQDVLNQESLPSLVVMDQNGRFKYAVIKECGNPVRARAAEPPARPTQPMPPPATTTPPRERTPLPTPPATTTPTPRRTYPPAQTYYPPAPPPRQTTYPPYATYRCTGIRAMEVDSNRADTTERTYRFEVSYIAENATLEEVVFDVTGAPNQAVSVASGAADNRVPSGDVTFDSGGNRYARAILRFNVNGQIRDETSEECAIRISVPHTEEAYQYDDRRDRYDEYYDRRDEYDETPASTTTTTRSRTTTVPAATKHTQTRELPSTGPAEMIGGALGMSGIVGSALYLRNSRRRLLNSILNKR